VGLALAGNGAAAAEELLRILRVDPADSSARLRLALVYRDDHRFADARRELQMLIAEFPGAAEVAAAQEALANL
jgi:Flp pilus assembly protein TadD